uniref:NADH-ubiquinone oxidoreductase chain 5 n=1 Tax=Molannodes epaphos TaxID=2904896 RepID=A0A9E8LPW0_9NEOP|nr:NADH dehydrogenase subunit 5 [Molannodes epaphos]UZZ44176.1 NADH dehydrogenase subunit 5 [Molannodes epaphos]
MYLSWYLIIFGILLVSGIFLFFLSILFIFNNWVIFIEWEIFSLNSIELVYVMLFDWISLIFMSFVVVISSMVVYYSKSYMGQDINKNRFILLVLLFVMSMMLMIVSPNMVSILLGWDGLGLVSFCLVIYYQNVSSYNAGMLTVLSNRVGDVAILMCIAWMLNFGGWNFFLYLNLMGFSLFFILIGGLVILASITKSAQIPFSAWLPAAMAAPTPVSALVHSSTLVTAGVYLMIRFFVLFEGSFLLNWVLLLGMMTMFMSGISANYEFDMKKIIALSTLSQLGLMMSILGLGFQDLALFHLLMHAFFKALLFLCAGVMIHSFKNFQDIRFMGNVVKYLPLTSSFFLISNLSLCGVPFLSGFYSKDLILEMSSMMSFNLFVYVIFYISMGLTICYSVRLYYYCFMISNNFFSLVNLNGEDYVMMKSMLLLLISSVVMGSVFFWFVLNYLNFIYLSNFMKFLIFYMMLGGVMIGSFITFNFKFLLGFWFSNLFIGKMWFLSILSVYGMNYKILEFSNFMVKILDFGWWEYLVSVNIYKNLMLVILVVQKIQKNLLKIFMLLFIFWILFFYVWVF